jgi:hypothetical protein
MTLLELSIAIEKLLVERNLRCMRSLHEALPPGYVLRAAEHLWRAESIIIGTGFPVEETFETDGPPGAIALYEALRTLRREVHLACADPLASVLSADYRVLQLRAFDLEAGRREAEVNLAAIRPDVVVSIERPGLSADGRYHNMRGEDISARCAVFDYYLILSACPTVAVGDGGNEVGMGKLAPQVQALDITPAATGCDELLVADVSNWGAYALIAMLQVLAGQPLLEIVRHTDYLAYLSARGSVDGVTRENTLTEDSLEASAGEHLLGRLQGLCDRCLETRARDMS